MSNFNEHEVSTTRLHRVERVRVVHHKNRADGDTYFYRTVITVSSKYGNIVLELFADESIPVSVVK